MKACAQALEDHPDEPRLIELLQSAHEQQAFQRALRSRERGPSLAYLDLYGNGRFADDVRQYLASLTPAPSTAQGQANSPAEQNGMGDRYFYGRGVEQDYAKAMDWYRKAADRGLADAEYSVGVLYENGWGVTKDIDRAKAGTRRPPIRATALRGYACSGFRRMLLQPPQQATKKTRS